MKICFLCDEYPPAPQGGIGSFVRDLAHGLVKRGHQVVVTGLYPRSEAGVENDNGVEIFRLAGSQVKGRLGLVWDRWQIRQAVIRLWRNIALDLVEAPDTGGWGVAMPRDLPVVIRLHSSVRYGESMGWRGPRGRLVAFTEDLAIRRASQVVAVSQWMADRAPIDYSGAGLTSGRIGVIHNGVDTELFKEEPYDLSVPGRVVFGGTLKPQKGLVPLLRAFRKMLQRRPKLELVIAGKDTSVGNQSYKSLAMEEAGLSPEDLNRVRWLGPVPREELPGLFASASVCVFPSLAESFGLVAAEAMSCGRPVVYSKTTVGPELIRHGVDGILIDPEEPSDIENAIAGLFSDPGTASQIGLRAAQRVREEFTLDRCISASIEMYEEVLDGVAR